MDIESQRELARRGRVNLEASLAQPHPESRKLERQGLDDWPIGLTEVDIEGIFDGRVGTPVSWIEGFGWRAR
jgi:hypothetical protein